MKLDIAKIDAEIERLQSLKRLASDPRMAELFERFASSNGSQEFVVTESSTPPITEDYSRGDLLRTVQQTCQLFEGQFTSSDVIAKMRDRGFKFKAKNPHIAVNGVLRKLLGKRNKIKLAEQGIGRTANRYEWIR